MMLQIDGLVQDHSNSIADALEWLQSCTKPSKWYHIDPDNDKWYRLEYQYAKDTPYLARVGDSGLSFVGIVRKMIVLHA